MREASLGARLAAALATLAIAGLALAGAATLAGTLAVGWGYYALPVAARDAHPLHPWLAPGGSWGVLLGVVGASLMVAMLAYTLRKWLPPQSWLARHLGGLNHWLRFHITCGVLGPLFIAFHSGFHWPRGLISIGFWCMVVVALSGVFGRYVYGFFPRVAGGRALAWEEAMSRLAELRAELVAATAGATGDHVGRAVQVVTGFELQATHLGHLVSLQREVRARRRKIDALLREAELAPDVRRRASATLADQLRLKRGLESLRLAHLLFRYWHLLHRPLAAAMYVIALLHIALSVVFGGSVGALLRLLG